MASLAWTFWSPLVVTAAWSTTWSRLASEYQPPAATLTASMTETAHASVKACALSATFTASAHATCRSEDCAASATLTASLAVALWSPLVVTAAWSTTWSPLTSEYQPPAETLTASMTETAHASVKACALSATFTASAHATCRSEDCAASATLTASLAVALWSPTGMDAVAVSLILTASLGTTDVVPGISSTMPRQAEDVVHEAVAVTPSLSVVLYCA